MSGYAGDESIYGLIPEPFHVPPKQPLYRSKFPGEPAHPPSAPGGDSNVRAPGAEGCERAQLRAPSEATPAPAGTAGTCCTGRGARAPPSRTGRRPGRRARGSGVGR